MHEISMHEICQLGQPQEFAKKPLESMPGLHTMTLDNNVVSAHNHMQMKLCDGH